MVTATKNEVGVDKGVNESVNEDVNQGDNHNGGVDVIVPIIVTVVAVVLAITLGAICYVRIRFRMQSSNVSKIVYDALLLAGATCFYSMHDVQGV